MIVKQNKVQGIKCPVNVMHFQYALIYSDRRKSLVMHLDTMALRMVNLYYLMFHMVARGSSNLAYTNP